MKKTNEQKIFQMINIIRNEDKLTQEKAVIELIKYIDNKINNSEWELELKKSLNALEEKCEESISLEDIKDVIMKRIIVRPNEGFDTNVAINSIIEEFSDKKEEILSIDKNKLGFQIFLNNQTEVSEPYLKNNKGKKEYFLEDILNIKKALAKIFKVNSKEYKEEKQYDKIIISYKKSDRTNYNEEFIFKTLDKLILDNKLKQNGIVIISGLDAEKRLKTIMKKAERKGLYVNKMKIFKSILNQIHANIIVLSKNRTETIKLKINNDEEIIERKSLLQQVEEFKTKEYIDFDYTDYIKREEKDIKQYLKKKVIEGDKKAILEEFLTIPKEDIVEIENEKEYKQITLHNNFKISKRTNIKGSEIKTKKQRVVKEGQLVISKINAFKKYISIIPKELEGAIITSSYVVLDIDKTKILPEYLLLKIKKEEDRILKSLFLNSSRKGSSRYYLNVKAFLKTGFEIDKTIEEQKKILNKIKGYEKRKRDLEKEIEKIKRNEI